MAPRVRTIKASGGQHATIQDWADNLDNASYYDPGDDAIGEVYNETYAGATITLGDTIGLNSITLRAHTGEEHNGTEDGGGATILASGASDLLVLASAVPINIEYIHIDGNGQAITNLVDASGQNQGTIRGCLLHGVARGGNARLLYWNNANAAEKNILDCFFWDLTTSSSGSAYGIYLNSSSTSVMNVMNCTVYKINATGSGSSYGIVNFDVANKTYKNLVVVESDAGGSSGTQQDYYDSSIATATQDYVIDSDGTGSGTHTATQADPSTLFTSLTPGSVDLTIKDTNADSYQFSENLGTTPTGVNEDILKRDRDAQGDTWDCGASQTVPAAGGTTLHTLPLLGVGK